MSKNLGLYPPVDMQGRVLLPGAMAFCTPTQGAPTVVQAVIAWSAYGVGYAKPNVGVRINLQAGISAGPTLDAIRSIKIDNTFSGVPVFVQFPDTGDTVSCPANSIIIANVATAAQTCIVYGTGFYDGRQPTTTVLFYNVGQPPAYFPAIAADNVLIRYIGTNNTPTGGGTVTLTWGPINTIVPPSPSRLIAVAIDALGNAAGGRNLVSATINGVVATIAVSSQATPATGTLAQVGSIIYALVPTGTTLTIVGTYNAAVSGVGASSATPFSIESYTQVAPLTDNLTTGVAGTVLTVQFDAIPGASALLNINQFGAVSIGPWTGANPFQNRGLGPYASGAATARFTEANGAAISNTGNVLVGAMWI